MMTIHSHNLNCRDVILSNNGHHITQIYIAKCEWISVILHAKHL